MERSTGILFVTNTLHPGGTEQVLLNLVQGLVQTGRFRPIVACLKAPGPWAENFQRLGAPVHANLLSDRYDVRVVPRLVRLMKRNNVRIVVSVGSGGDRMFWSALAAKIAGAKTVVWSHTFSQPEHPEFELANRVIYPLVDRFVALGSRHQACLAWRDKIPYGKITIIPNGIEVGPDGYPQWRDRARAVLGLADENIVAVAMIANLRPSKRHDLFIEAARLVVRQFRDIHFFIIGDGPLRTSVRDWAQRSELLGSYLSLLGHREDVPQLLPGLDLVCLCSEYQECQSMVALQAMAAGIPVISNHIGSMDEAITDNRTGFFYHPLSPAALAEKILHVAPNAPLRQQIADASRRQVGQKFTQDRLVRDFTHLFENLLADPTRFNGRLAELF